MKPLRCMSGPAARHWPTSQKAAMKEYLKGAPNPPVHLYEAAQIAFREGDYVATCA